VRGGAGAVKHNGRAGSVVVTGGEGFSGDGWLAPHVHASGSSLGSPSRLAGVFLFLTEWWWWGVGGGGRGQAYCDALLRGHGLLLLPSAHYDYHDSR
jgi:hypothetical protein